MGSQSRKRSADSDRSGRTESLGRSRAGSHRGGRWRRTDGRISGSIGHKHHHRGELGPGKKSGGLWIESSRTRIGTRGLTARGGRGRSRPSDRVASRSGRHIGAADHRQTHRPTQPTHPHRQRGWWNGRRNRQTHRPRRRRPHSRPGGRGGGTSAARRRGGGRRHYRNSTAGRRGRHREQEWGQIHRHSDKVTGAG